MKDPKIYFEDILECIEKIDEYSENINEDDFYENSLIQDAIIRRLEIIGEAVKKIPYEIRGKYPDIPWKSIAGTRDVLIHNYGNVNVKRVWLVVEKDIPKLKDNILKIIDEL